MGKLENKLGNKMKRITTWSAATHFLFPGIIQDYNSRYYFHVSYNLFTCFYLEKHHTVFKDLSTEAKAQLMNTLKEKFNNLTEKEKADMKAKRMKELAGPDMNE